MGFRDSLDMLVHRGVPKPDSYERKKNYHFGDELGNIFSLGFFLPITHNK